MMTKHKKAKYFANVEKIKEKYKDCVFFFVNHDGDGSGVHKFEAYDDLNELLNEKYHGTKDEYSPALSIWDMVDLDPEYVFTIDDIFEFGICLDCLPQGYNQHNYIELFDDLELFQIL